MKYSLFIISILLFVSCNNNSRKCIEEKAKADSIYHTSIYPAEIIKKHLEKKYDNAVWLLYASNFLANKISCNPPNKIFQDTSILTFYPRVEYLDDTPGDSIEIWFAFTDSSNSIWCYTIQRINYNIYGFSRGSDSVLYRKMSGYTMNNDTNGNLWNKSDSLKKMVVIEQVLNKYKIPYNLDTIPAFNRKNGDYPIDEQNKLFIQYLKTRKKQISPPLMRLCKQRKIF